MPAFYSRSRVRLALSCVALTFSLLLVASLWLRPLLWKQLSTRLSGSLVENSLTPAVALGLHGPWKPGLPLADRRRQTELQLALIKRGKPALLVLEDWLDEPLSVSASGLGEAIRQDVPVLVALGATHRQGHFKSLSETVQALKSARAFKVSKKTGRRQKLGVSWQVARQPGLGLLLASAGAGVVETEAGEAEEIPLLFELGHRWLPSLGLEALLRYWAIPRKGLHFIFNKQGRLASLELKGYRHPITRRGTTFLPLGQAGGIPDYPLGQVITDATLFKGIRGRVIFFRPWPAQLGDASVFDRQRALFAGLINETLLAEKPQSSPPWSLAMVLACFYFISLFTGKKGAWVLATLTLMGFALAWLYEIENGLQGFVASTAVLSWAFGLGALKKFESSGTLENDFTSVVASRKIKIWKKRFNYSSSRQSKKEGTVKGVYLVVKGLPEPIADFESWMENYDAFLDPGERDKIAIFLPLGSQGRFPMEAVWDFYEKVNKSASVFTMGDLHFESSRWMGQFRWNLTGEMKRRAFALCEKAQKERLLTTEAEYQLIRQRVKIQMLGSQSLDGGASETKIFNILELLS